jgi:hypothetical protein
MIDGRYGEAPAWKSSPLKFDGKSIAFAERPVLVAKNQPSSKDRRVPRLCESWMLFDVRAPGWRCAT